MTFLRPTTGGVLLTVRVQPRAARSEVVGPLGDTLKVRVAAPPLDGAANQELIRFLAEALEIPKPQISLRSGASSRTKTLFLGGLSPSGVRASLGLEN